MTLDDEDCGFRELVVVFGLNCCSTWSVEKFPRRLNDADAGMNSGAFAVNRDLENVVVLPVPLLEIPCEDGPPFEDQVAFSNFELSMLAESDWKLCNEA